MKKLHHTGLALAVAAGLLAAASAQAQQIVDPGDSVVVEKGDPTESWRVENGGMLTLNPGASATNIVALDNAIVNIDGGSITNTNVLTKGLALEGATANLKNATISAKSWALVADGSTASIADSTITSDSAAVVGYGDIGAPANITIENSALRQDGGGGAAQAAMVFVGGEVNMSLTRGSTASSSGYGAYFGVSARALIGTHRLIVDASHLESAGTALFVTDAGAGVGPGGSTFASIQLNNGSTVKARNGVLLQTQGLSVASLTIDNSDISGDVINDKANGAEARIFLRNNAMLTGAMRDASRASVESAQWNISGDSSVDTLQLGTGGVVAFQAPTGGTHKTLTVGDFTGADGTLVFNAVLGNDASASDKLVVTGDTSGTANVRVNNIGGAGALTYKGIELISVGGASDGVFTLAGRAVGGAYEYFLHKGTGADGNWYLRSQTPTTGPEPCDLDPSSPWCDPDNPGPLPGTDPGDEDPYPMPKPEPGDEDPYPLPGVDPDYPDPENPGNPDPIQRPEGGAYLANLQAAQQMFRTGYRDRQPGQNAGRAWAKVDGSRNSFDASSRQLDVSGNSQSLSVGANVWQHDSGSSAGVMLSSGNASSTSTNDLTGYYARGKVRGEALGVYGTWRGGNAADPNAGFYVDGSLQRAQFRNRVEGVGLEAERYSSDAWQGAVEAGYAFRVGGASNGGIYLEPQLQLGYSRVSVGEHTEVNGTVVQAHAASGVFGRAGARLSGVTQWGNSGVTVQPYVAVNWLYNGADASVRMNDEMVDARIPRNRAELSGGASVDFGNGFGAWGGVSLQKASGYHQSSAQVGLSYRW